MLSEHKITSQGIFNPLRHLFSTVVDPSLLKDQNPPFLGFDVEIPAICVAPDSCRASLDAFISEIDLEGNTRFASVRKLQLPIAVPFEKIPLPVSQETETFINTKKVQKRSRLNLSLIPYPTSSHFPSTLPGAPTIPSHSSPGSSLTNS